MSKNMDFTGYDPISLIMALERVSFPEAVDRLARRIHRTRNDAKCVVVSNYFGA